MPNKLSLHFDEDEFLCKCPRHEGAGLISPQLVKLLESMRQLYGKAIRISSGYRCAEHNAAVGGKDNSAHLTGEAADIVAIFPDDRFGILGAAFAAGARRIGIGSSFIHVDVKTTLPNDVSWLYED